MKKRRTYVPLAAIGCKITRQLSAQYRGAAKNIGIANRGVLQSIICRSRPRTAEERMGGNEQRNSIPRQEAG